MKRGWTIIGLFLMISFAACRQMTIKPGVVAERFLLDVYGGNMREAAGYATRQGQQQLKSLQEDMSKLGFGLADTFWLKAPKTSVGRDTLHFNYVIDTTCWNTPRDLPVIYAGTKGWRVDFSRTDPVGIARYFLDAFYHGDFDRAEQYVTLNAVNDIQYAATVYKGWKGPGVELTAIKFNPRQNKALVSYHEIGNKEIKKLTLILENGNWRVAFSKFGKI